MTFKSPPIVKIRNITVAFSNRGLWTDKICTHWIHTPFRAVFSQMQSSWGRYRGCNVRDADMLQKSAVGLPAILTEKPGHCDERRRRENRGAEGTEGRGVRRNRYVPGKPGWLTTLVSRLMPSVTYA
jgi:hypothetical protein